MALKSALIRMSTVLLAAGCTFHAAGEAHSGAGQQEQAPPPPPPPAPAPTPAAPAPAATPTAAPANPAPASTSQVDKEGKVKIPGNIVFETDSAKIKEAESLPTLTELKKFLDDNPRVTKLRIEGHTDNKGTHDHNVQLSGKRALAIKQWLISKGIKAERLLAVGFAETRPVADNATDDGRAQNRRTEFHIAELDGNKYLGKPPNGPPGGQVFE